MRALINKYNFTNAELEDEFLRELDKNQNKQAVRLRTKLNNRRRKERRLVA